MADLLGSEAHGEKNSRDKHRQDWAVQGWVTRREEGCSGEKISTVKCAQA